MPAPQTQKTCYSCGKTLPLDQFRRRKAGQERRMGNCRLCYNESMRIYRQSRQLRRIEEFNTELKQAVSLRRVVAMCNAMFASFGGMDAFCASWKASVDAAPPGSKQALDAYLAVLHMIELLDAAKRSGPSVAKRPAPRVGKRVAW